MKTYSSKRVLQGADKYGIYKEGKLVTAENIAGRVIDKQLNSYRDRNYLNQTDNE